jgi:hypothetical protein
MFYSLLVNLERIIVGKVSISLTAASQRLKGKNEQGGEREARWKGLAATATTIIVSQKWAFFPTSPPESSRNLVLAQAAEYIVFRRNSSKRRKPPQTTKAGA